MIGHDDFDRILAGWFEADARSVVPGGGLDRVRDMTRRRRPLPGWLASLGSRWVGDPSASGTNPGLGSLLRPRDLRWSTVLILLLVLATLLGGAILIGARLLQSPPLRTDRLGHLAYGLDGDTYVADWDGRNPVRIADGDPITGADSCGGFWGEGAIWAPDGRHLAYRSYWSDACPGVVYIADPDGHTVASFPGTGWLISWSPDSTRVATWAGEAIGIYGVNGTRQALLTVPPGFMAPGDFDPVWSPDGRSLFVPLGGQVPLDGSKPVHLPPDDPRSHWQTAYSPDGARAAYLTYPGGLLIVAAADGSQARPVVAEGRVESFGWSPTGDRIAFVAATGSVDPQQGAADELRLLDLASGSITTLAEASGTDPFRAIRFSPDGDRILFAVTDRHQSLWTIRTDGSDKRLLVAGTGWGDWQWLPAGSQ
jgi:Tol biopolymer transport system component